MNPNPNPNPNPPLTPEAIIDGALRLANDSVHLMRDAHGVHTPEPTRSDRAGDYAYRLYPADQHRHYLVLDCYLTGAVETLKLLHGDLEPEPWFDIPTCEGMLAGYLRRLQGLFAAHCIQPNLPYPTIYCPCWHDHPSGQPGIRYWEYWYGVVPGISSPPDKEHRPYIFHAQTMVGQVICDRCGRLAPWRGEPVGQIGIIGVAYILSRFYLPNGKRRPSDLPDHLPPPESQVGG